jgi:hypothetical protein
MNQCPMLERCKTASGIDCTDRDFENCVFLLKLQREKEGKYKKVRK